jgi:hypothetical protein
VSGNRRQEVPGGRRQEVPGNAVGTARRLAEENRLGTAG